MILNFDCIREILLYVKINTIYGNVKVDSLIDDLSKYEKDVLLYHIKKLDSKDIFEEVVYFDENPSIISGLSPKGCDYLKRLLIINY